jgi:hypothetical protein
MAQPEAVFKRRLTTCFTAAYLADAWWSYVKPTKIGTPDLVFSRLTLGTLWIEAKANGEDLSKGQELQIGKMRAAGMKVIVIDAHMTRMGASVPWPQWLLNIDFLSSRRGNQICEGALMLTEDFWEGLFS